MVLECRIPVSPTPSFLNRVVLIAASIRRFYPDAIVRAYVGQPEGPTVEAYDAILKAFSGHKIGFEWVRKTDFDFWKGSANEYVSTMVRRYKPPYYGDHILMLDADCICTDRFDELFDVDALSGVQAHVPPLKLYDWCNLYIAHCIKRLGDNLVTYSGHSIMFNDSTNSVGPPYFNTGVVFGPTHTFSHIHEEFLTTLKTLRTQMNSYFFEQIALTLAAEKTRTPINTVPLRYNFPNQAAFDAARPEELTNCKFLHFLRTDTIDRDKDFESVEALERLVARTDLTGSNELLRQHVWELLPCLK